MELNSNYRVRSKFALFHMTLLLSNEPLDFDVRIGINIVQDTQQIANHAKAAYV
jgi:hypothetical protein